MKTAGSGFISQRHVSADPDPNPDPQKCHGAATLMNKKGDCTLFVVYYSIIPGATGTKRGSRPGPSWRIPGHTSQLAAR